MCHGGMRHLKGSTLGWWVLGRARMLQVAGVVLDGLADVTVKDKLLLLRVADFCPLRWSGLFPSDSPDTLESSVLWWMNQSAFGTHVVSQVGRQTKK